MMFVYRTNCKDSAEYASLVASGAIGVAFVDNAIGLIYKTGEVAIKFNNQFEKLRSLANFEDTALIYTLLSIRLDELLKMDHEAQFLTEYVLFNLNLWKS